MAQEQKRVNSQEVSSKSFDDILERMRSRVSEISDQGRVRQILDEDQSDTQGNTAEAAALNEGEQDRAFAEMSKQILNPTQSDEGVGNEATEDNSAALDTDETSSLIVEAPEYVEEDKVEAETYSQILEALQMKDLSSLRSAHPNELEKIVSSPAKDTKEKTAEDEHGVIIMGAPTDEEDETELSEVMSKDENANDSDEPAQTVASSDENSEEAVLDETRVTSEEETDKSVEDTAMAAKDKVETPVTASVESEEVVSDADQPVEETKRDYTLAFDRLTKIASTMGKSLDEKKANVEAVAEETVSLQEVSAAVETAKPTEEPVAQKVNDVAETENSEQAQKIVSEVKVVSADPDPLFAVFEERNSEHNKRLDDIELALQSLAQSHQDMEKRSTALLQQQEESLRLVTRESQKVAEATAAKLSEKLAAQMESKTNQEHSVLRADMETVQTGLLELVNQFEGSAKTNNNAYEMMQTSLAALHDKMNDFGAEQEKMRAEHLPAVQSAPEKSVRDHIHEAFSAETGKQEPRSAPAPMPVPAAQEQVQAGTENLSLSSQVLRNFVNAPLVQHPEKTDEQPQSLFGTRNGTDDMGAPAEPAIHRSFSDQEGHNETILVDKNQKGSKAPVLLAVSSMFMFSVAGFLFYDHYQKQGGLNVKLASTSQFKEKTVARNTVNNNASGLIGEKKIVEWTYNGKKKENVAQLAKTEKVLDGNGLNNFTDVTSNTEIIEVASAQSSAPLTTSSIGGSSSLSLAKENISKKSGSFKRPSVLIGSTSLRHSAGKGVASAMFEVARRYQNGKGVKKNYKEAVKWYRRAAEKEYAPAQYRLGTLYERGRGVTKSIENARDWYRRSAKLGNVKAMHNLGVIFSGQKKIRPDYALAIQWFTKAAKYGLADSQFNLAIINYNGLGKTKDIVEAYKWFALASKNGDKAAKEQQESIAQKMKLKQIMDGRKKANTWKNKTIPTKSNIDLSQKYSWQDFAEL